jgi:hypothetical protein
MFMQNFSSLDCTQTDLDKFLTFFQEKFKIFFKENLKFSKFKRSSGYRFPKGIFYQILSHLAFFESFQNWFKIFLTPEFFKDFQNFKILNMRYTNEAGSQNFSFLARYPAQLAAPQISSKFRRQRRVTDGNLFFVLNSFFRYKKS